MELTFCPATLTSDQRPALTTKEKYSNFKSRIIPNILWESTKPWIKRACIRLEFTLTPSLSKTIFKSLLSKAEVWLSFLSLWILIGSVTTQMQSIARSNTKLLVTLPTKFLCLRLGKISLIPVKHPKLLLQIQPPKSELLISMIPNMAHTLLSFIQTDCQLLLTHMLISIWIQITISYAKIIVSTRQALLAPPLGFRGYAFAKATITA